MSAPSTPDSLCRSTLATLAIITLVGAVLRIAFVPESHGIDWDGALYVHQAEHIPEVLAGTFPSVHGKHATVLYPLGLPALMRALTPVFGSTRDAGVAVSLAGGIAAIPLAFLIGRRLRSPGAGILAAGLVALDPPLVVRSSRIMSEPVFLALLWAGVLPFLDRPLRRMPALAGTCCLLAAASVRMVGIPIALVAGAAGLWRRPDERPLVKTVALVLCIGTAGVWGFQKVITMRNDAAPYGLMVAEYAFQIEGATPRAWDVDAEGTSISGGTERVDLAAVARAHPRLVVKIPAESTWRAFLAFFPFVAFVPFAFADPHEPRRRAAVVSIVVAVGLAIPIAMFFHASDIGRMAVPHRLAVYALFASGALALAARARLLAPGRDLAAPWAALVAVAAGVAYGSPLGHLLSLRDLGAPGSVRAQADAFAAQMARFVPPTERVLRGPGGDVCLIALSGRLSLNMPDTTPPKLHRFCEANDARWVLYSPQIPLVRERFAPWRLVPVVADDKQVLARVLVERRDGR